MQGLGREKEGRLSHTSMAQIEYEVNTYIYGKNKSPGVVEPASVTP